MSALVVVAVIAAVMGLLTFVLYPYGSRSQVTWIEFREQPSVDAVCVGSSLGKRSFNPFVFDEQLGTNSFNLCTPYQSVSESSLGMQEAFEQNDVKYVLYAVDIATLSEPYEMYPGRVYLNEKWKGDDFFQRFSDLAYALPDCSWMSTDKSINWLFPWVEQRVPPSGMLDNIVMQLDGTTPGEASEHLESLFGRTWTNFGKGYGGFEEKFDYNGSNLGMYVNIAMEPLDEMNLRYLADLCDRCREEGAVLLAYVAPRPEFALIDMYPRYGTYSAQLASLVEEHGGVYCDLNLAKPELYTAEEEHFQDGEHCNVEGANAVTMALASLVKRIEGGEDVSGLFMSYEEKFNGIDDISIALLSDEVTPNGIELHASCLAGPSVKPEYQFVATDANGVSTVVQDYSQKDSCLYAPPDNGIYEVRVNVRQLGSDAEFEKHTQHEVVY